MQEQICSREDMERLIETFGFLPFFTNTIPGFSLEEHTPAQLWYNGSVDGRDDWPVWDWKGPVASSGSCMYGKFFQKKAGFIGREWIPDFLNVRRNGMTFDEWYEEGLIFYKDKALLDTVRTYGAVLTPHLKMQCNYRKGGNTGFDTVVTRMQMQTWLCISDFAYRVDKFGREYGWGVALYTTPEAQFGEDVLFCPRTPSESRERILDYLASILPHVSEQQLLKMLG
ncbi:MAG: hypothetical protein II049_05475 [Clostridia bacterium]|nr:hypothetical protein [Clostridia bacterium]